MLFLVFPTRKKCSLWYLILHRDCFSTRNVFLITVQTKKHNTRKKIINNYSFIADMSFRRRNVSGCWGTDFAIKMHATNMCSMEGFALSSVFWFSKYLDSFWRVSPSIGAFCLHGQVWNTSKSGLLVNFARFWV